MENGFVNWIFLFFLALSSFFPYYNNATVSLAIASSSFARTQLP